MRSASVQRSPLEKRELKRYFHFSVHFKHLQEQLENRGVQNILPMPSTMPTGQLKPIVERTVGLKPICRSSVDFCASGVSGVCPTGRYRRWI